MAVRIRLRRIGAKKRPFYRVVVADSRSPRDGRFLDTLGWYDPLSDPARIEIDDQKALRWLAEGAEPTDSARSVLSRAGVMSRHAGLATAATEMPPIVSEAPAAETPLIAEEPPVTEPEGEEA